MQQILWYLTRCLFRNFCKYLWKKLFCLQLYLTMIHSLIRNITLTTPTIHLVFKVLCFLPKSKSHVSSYMWTNLGYISLDSLPARWLWIPYVKLISYCTTFVNNSNNHIKVKYLSFCVCLLFILDNIDSEDNSIKIRRFELEIRLQVPFPRLFNFILWKVFS